MSSFAFIDNKTFYTYLPEYWVELQKGCKVYLFLFNEQPNTIVLQDTWSLTVFSKLNIRLKLEWVLEIPFLCFFLFLSDESTALAVTFRALTVALPLRPTSWGRSWQVPYTYDGSGNQWPKCQNDHGIKITTVLKWPWTKPRLHEVAFTANMQ